jgi:O-antigen/teichoic acid export membrane protein
VTLLARNVLWNLLGQVAPLGAAIIAIPVLIRALGTDRFGILTIAWVVIGYFSLFDLGLGRALTQLVARELGTPRGRDAAYAVVWTSLALMLALGLVGGLALAALGSWLVHDMLRIPPSLQDESQVAFYLLATTVPVVITASGLRGLLEAHQRFGLSNAIRAPLGISNFIGPLLVLPFSSSMVSVVLVLVLSRVLTWLAYLLACFHVMPVLRKGFTFEQSAVWPLLRFGGWITVSNIVGPIMVYVDRLLIGALKSVAAVAYFATPYEMVTRLWVIPGAMAGVLFPAFSTSFVQDRSRTASLFGRGVKYVFLILFPVTLIIVTFAHEGLALWLGRDFAHHSTRVLQWLAVGMFVNSLAQIAFALVQGAGRADLTAKLHLVELPFYLIGLWALLTTLGIEGAAIAWAARALVDMLLLFTVAYRLLPRSVASPLPVAGPALSALATLGLAISPMSFGVKGPFVFVTLLAFASAAWFWILSPEERALGRQSLRLARFFN